MPRPTNRVLQNVILSTWKYIKIQKGKNAIFFHHIMQSTGDNEQSSRRCVYCDWTNTC